MTREDLIAELIAEMGAADTDIDGDEPRDDYETPDLSGYSDEMLIEEGRLYGILGEDEGIEDDVSPSPLVRYVRGRGGIVGHGYKNPRPA